MRISSLRIFVLAVPVVAAALLAGSCTRGAKVTFTVKDAPSQKLILRELSGNTYTLLDTLKTNAAGEVSYTVPVEKGQPEFVYLYKGDDRIASLLLQNGERVKVVTDLSGNCSVEGSPESVKLLEVERDEAVYANTFASSSAKLADLDPDSEAAVQVRREIAKDYIAYYRSRVQYLFKNYKSLTAIPVLYQVVGGVPVFGQATDALHFRACCDSLKTVYPDSKYVKALEEETLRRENLMDISQRINQAEAAGFPDIELPDTKGQKVRLSATEGKLILLYFWSSAAAEQKMLNFQTLKPVYEQYHSRGLEIYAVCVDTDKTAWATTVRTQGLDWINVCDGLGVSGKAVASYNVTSVPTVFFIKDGTLLSSTSVKDESTLKAFIAGQLR